MSAPFQAGRSVGEGAHPNLRIVDDGEVGLPVVPSPNRLPNGLCYGRRGHERESKTDNSCRCGQISMKSKRPEICVEREDHSALLLCSCQHHLVICPGMGRLRPGDVVTVFTKSLQTARGTFWSTRSRIRTSGGT